MTGIPVGSTRLYANNRIALPKRAQKKLKIEVGDVIFFVEDEETGRIYLISKVEE